jgi:hypothetical protein
MNSIAITRLLLNGAYITEGKIFHPSFKKGYRVHSGSMSIYAVENQLRKIGMKLVENNGIKTAQ